MFVYGKPFLLLTASLSCRQLFAQGWGPVGFPLSMVSMPIAVSFLSTCLDCHVRQTLWVRLFCQVTEKRVDCEKSGLDINLLPRYYILAQGNLLGRNSKTVCQCDACQFLLKRRS